MKPFRYTGQPDIGGFFQFQCMPFLAESRWRILPSTGGFVPIWPV